MCWSSSASVLATGAGVAATVYAAKKGYPKAQVFTLAFFTLMEFLQAASYIWIGECGMGENVLLTRLSYMHIAFQPPVVSAFMLSFTSKKTREKWFKLVMGVSFVSTILLLSKMFVPMMWDVPQEYMCRVGEALCGTDVCTYRGDWHQAWRLPLLGVIPAFFVYNLPVFIMPIFYGAWRISLYHAALGPILAYMLTTDPNEAPAIWCLFSVALLGAMFVKPLRKLLAPS